MIDNRHGFFIPSCDICGEELPREFDFCDAVEAGVYNHEQWFFSNILDVVIETLDGDITL